MNILEEHRVLWGRLNAYSLDDPTSKLTFSSRLAEENHWTRDFAAKVIEEYKRFVFLGQVAGHPVTPSDEVDQVWHLHMLYNHEYLDVFCATILKKPFYHGPTKGGNEEHVKHHDWYARTKESYERIFGTKPPENIWPPNAIRFSGSYVRINAEDHIVIKKDDFPLISRCIILAMDLAVKIKQFKLKLRKTKHTKTKGTPNEIENIQCTVSHAPGNPLNGHA